jgi:hypothetical protein
MPAGCRLIAIGLEENPVAGSELLDAVVGVVHIGSESKYQAVLSFQRCVRVAASLEQRRQMTGVREPHAACFGVHDGISRRHLRSIEVATQDLVFDLSTKAGSRAGSACAAKASLTIEETSAAGIPWPITSATRMPRASGPISMKSETSPATAPSVPI